MSDSARPFAPVVIETSHVGRLRSVTPVREAAECLLAGWPEKGRGPTYRAALCACHDTLAGKRKPEAARLAFIKAAQEIGIFVRASSGRRGSGM
jgi:Protein of unknown function (DUF982)